MRALLQSYFSRQPEFTCDLMAGSLEEFLTHLPALKSLPQLVLLDSGLEALLQLRRQLPDADFMLHTVFDDTDRLYQALCAGATSYLLKSTLPAELKAALLDVAHEEVSSSRAVAHRLLALAGRFAGAAWQGTSDRGEWGRG